jgi:RimJ/RimL family protein N-acetyltransferase
LVRVVQGLPQRGSFDYRTRRSGDPFFAIAFDDVSNRIGPRHRSGPILFPALQIAMSNCSSRALFRSLKAAAGTAGPSLGIPVGVPIRAWLRPVSTHKAQLNANDVTRLTQWRNRYTNSFLTEFTATERQTARWLTDTVGPDDTRILLMLDDLQGRTFGYMGLAFIDWEKMSGEADAIVRGADAPRGLMTEALRALIGWAKGQLGLSEISVRVRSDNTALQFYFKFGFAERWRVPLRKTEQNGKTVWVEDATLASSPVALVHMRLS